MLNRFITFLFGFFLTVIPHPLFADGLGIFPEGHKPKGPLAFILIAVAMFVAIAAHELGHLLAGLAQGFRFELFVVGLLGIKRENGKVKVYLNNNIGMMGGVAATIPTKQDNDLRKKFARLILAGPLASLGFGIVSILLAYVSPPMLALFLLTAGFVSLSLCLATTLPGKTGVYFTDRKRYQRMISKGKEGDSEEALLRIIAQSTADGHHKNISVQQALTLQQDDTSFMKFWGYYYEHLYYKENGITDKAEQTKTTLLANQSLVGKQIWKALKIDE